MKRVNEKNIKVLAGKGYIVAKGRRFPNTRNVTVNDFNEEDYEISLEMTRFFLTRLDISENEQETEYWYIKVMYQLYDIYLMKMLDLRIRQGFKGTCKSVFPCK